MNRIVQKSRRALSALFGAQARPGVRRFWWAMFWCWMAAVFTISSLSSQQLDPVFMPIMGWDKVLHFVAFACGGAVLAFALRLSTRLAWRRILLLAVLIVSLYGALDEYHQLYTPSRSGGDVGDWIADTLGAIAGAFAARWFYVRRSKTNPPAPARD